MRIRNTAGNLQKLDKNMPITAVVCAGFRETVFLSGSAIFGPEQRTGSEYVLQWDPDPSNSSRYPVSINLKIWLPLPDGVDRLEGWLATL